jgi:hypothetical protein
MMLREWLQTDPEASWEKLAAALTTIGHETTAVYIRSQFVKEQHGAVSTHPPMEFKLQNIVTALKEVQDTRWYDLGLQLQLPPSTLDSIAADHESADDCKRIMLSKWLSEDPEASWERMAAALTMIGHENTAANIRSQLVYTVSATQLDSDECKLNKYKNKLKYEIGMEVPKVHKQDLWG